jgi:hypothetical protein
MAQQEIQPNSIFLSWEHNKRIQSNVIDFIPEFHIISIIDPEKICIFIKKSDSDEKEFYKSIFRQLETDKKYIFLQEDERQLATLYKVYKIENIKEWFIKIPKVINRTNELPIDTNILETIAFELQAYNQSLKKYSKDFSFTYLLFQRLEAKIELANQISKEADQKDSIIADILQETDYTLCIFYN